MCQNLSQFLFWNSPILHEVLFFYFYKNKTSIDSFIKKRLKKKITNQNELKI